LPESMQEWAELLEAVRRDLPYDLIEPVLSSLKPRLEGPGQLKLELLDPGLMPVASRLQKPLRERWRQIQGPTATLQVMARDLFSALLRGPGNTRAFELAEEWTAGNLASLYVQGGPGSGKTALLRSLPGSYLSARELLKRKPIGQGPLLIDDFDTLRKATGLDSWIVEAMDRGQPLCFSGRHFPDRLPLAERLLSRLQSIPRARLGQPDMTLRSSYFEQLRGMPVDPSARSLLTQARSFRDVERIAYQLHFSFPEQDTGQAPSVEDIQQTVAAHFQISAEDLLSRSRRSEFIPARHIAMYLAARHTGLSKSAVARAFRRNDHSTIIHACQRIDESFAVYEQALCAIANKLRINLHVPPKPM